MKHHAPSTAPGIMTRALHWLPAAVLTALIWGAAALSHGAIAFGTIGAVAAGSTSLSVAYPASISAGDLLVLCVSNKHNPNGPATPSGWTLPTNGQGTGGSGADNVNTGSVISTVFYKIADGSETGSLAVTITSGHSSQGVMLRYTKGSGTWGIAAHQGADNSAGTSWSVTGGGDPGLTTADMLLVCSAANDNAVTFDTEVAASTGVTFGTMAERADAATATGNDSAIVVSEHPVSSGTSSGAPTFTMTASTAPTADSPAGASVFLRLREVSSGSAVPLLMQLWQMHSAIGRNPLHNITIIDP